MLCVSLGRGRHTQLLADHRAFVDQGAQLVELRLDYLDKAIDLKRLLIGRPGPVIVTIRRLSDGGKWIGREPDRLLLLRQAIAEGVEYVDLEEDIAASVPRFGTTKRIVSLHDMRQTPANLEGIHARLSRLDPDIVKIGTMANHPRDNMRMLRLTRNSKTPTIGLCMGEIGTPSRILSKMFGSYLTYATFHHERALAPGQLTFQQMRDIYRYDDLNLQTTVYGVIGDPIAQSFSPHVHNAALREAGLNAVYVPFRVPPGDLDDFLASARELGVRGLSVTIPHKEAVLKHLAKMDGSVQAVGACNTLVFDGTQNFGYNTDYRAALEALEQAVGMTEGGPNKLAHKMALVLGAGGGAKAIAIGLARREMQVVIASRTLARAEELAQRVKGRAVEWSHRHGVVADVLVNCTPIGMHPNVDDSPYEKGELRPSMLVFDTVYNPENTLLIKDARSRSCLTVTGMEMFVRQAALQFQLFTGRQAPMPLMRDVLKRAINPVKY